MTLFGEYARTEKFKKKKNDLKCKFIPTKYKRMPNGIKSTAELLKSPAKTRFFVPFIFTLIRG